MTLTDKIRKALTIYLGECWLWDEDLDDEGMCKKCGQCFESHRLNRTFDTDADMMALVRKLKDSNEFSNFWHFAVSKDRNAVEFDWLFYDPERFCNLVAEWLEVKK